MKSVQLYIDFEIPQLISDDEVIVYDEQTELSQILAIKSLSIKRFGSISDIVCKGVFSSKSVELSIGPMKIIFIQFYSLLV